MQGSSIIYPSSDGKRMADNTLQHRWMVTIAGGLEGIFRSRPDVFVAGDLLWYPVEGISEISAAPDVMVVFGRPKGDRTSYLQWEEDNIPPQVVFEILSESNTLPEMWAKEDFYEEHGVEEFYEYDPIGKEIRGWQREGAIFRKIRKMNGWISPLLKIRFTMDDDLVIYGPDGKNFLPYSELVADRNHAYQRAEKERERAEKERERADQSTAENEKLRALLRAKGINPDAKDEG